MTKKSDITQKDFNRLLNWLDKDKEAAAEKYRSIHHRLVQIFLARRAFPAEELADRTIDRVIQKIEYLVGEYEGEPALYFYSIANKIFFEHLRNPKTEPLDDRFVQNEFEETSEVYYECLNECLQSISSEQRKLFVKYFQHQKQTKIEHHKKMAEKLGLDVKALRTRIYRIRMTLEKCVSSCVRKKNM